MKRIAITLTILAVTLVVVLQNYSGISSTADRPNIIVIFTDDHGYADLSSQGVLDDISTPHIDSLAAGGVRMTSGYVTAPQCVPSRAGLLTGKYQNRFGVESNGRPLEGFNTEKTIAERLRQAGYATGIAGKWHLGPPPEIVQHGFDAVFIKSNDGPGWANVDLAGKQKDPGPAGSDLYHIDANTAAARAFIEQHHDRPFFFYLAYRAPHVPLDPPKEYFEQLPADTPQRRRKALAMLSAVDAGVGGVLDTLRKHGIEDNTLIFFVSDNGAVLKIHKSDISAGGTGWNGSLNDPFNGEKGMLTEGGIRVPFIAYWKDKLPAGQVYDHPVISLDVTATAIAAAGLPPDPQLDGIDLVPHLLSKQTGSTASTPTTSLANRTLYWRWIDQSAVREGRWKYLRGGAREYLFDLAADQGEKNNLLQQKPEIAEHLRSRLVAWAGELDSPGIETEKMSGAWERYFDFYLEGKPFPGQMKAWVARNGSAEFKDGVLRVRPLSGQRTKAPFIVPPPFELDAPLTAVIQMRTATSDTAALAWRETNQGGFPKNQVVTFSCEASQSSKRYELDIPAHGKIVHLRLSLPATGADVEQIELLDTDRKPVKVWLP